ncbi:MAG: mandelate racemase/muconate lactonizing enzyme family protein [Ardenticatenaceae bacterium]|nr:mandelate racemase/muconate lactonizing enzyme family protein [Ardenticatenaceae bacterium]
MKIADIQTYHLNMPIDEFAFSQKWVRARTALIIKVVTDDGTVGWGEAFCHDAGRAIEAIISQTFRPHLIGRNPLEINVLWDHLYNWTKDYGQKGIVISALSAVDIALWDILGKVSDLPIVTLLGGQFYDRIQGYATGLYMRDAADDRQNLADEARSYIEEGFKHLKMKVGYGLAKDISIVTAVREAVGDDIHLMIDANHAYDATTAIRLGKKLSHLNIDWFEEPVSPEDIEGYAEVRQAIDIPVAGGEAEFTRFGFRQLLTQRAVDIVQPDICAAGGLTEGRRIADMARTWHTRCIPHVWGTAIGRAASLHFIASLPPTPPALFPQKALLELDLTPHPLRDEVVLNPPEVVNGWVTVPQAPGLGVEVNESFLEANSRSNIHHHNP